MIEEKTKLVWVRVRDEQVIHVWKKSNNDKCGEALEEFCVYPNWYEKNGIPSCECGKNLTYSHTEYLKVES